MADLVTPNFGLTKPEVGSSGDTWGNKLNFNFDIIDTKVGSKTTTSVMAPDNPKIGDMWYNTNSGLLSVWDGSNWAPSIGLLGPPGPPGVPGSAVVGDSPPIGELNQGHLWWDSNSGNLFVWYEDIDSGQWVQITGPTGVAGKDGSMMLSGEGPPSAELGGNEDTYIDTTIGQIWRKESGAWVNTGENIFGTIPTEVEAAKDAALVAEANAEAAQVAAEAARDVAVADTGIYPNTAAGLTAVAEGDYFYVAPATTSDPILLYREEGGVAVLKGSHPSAAQLQAVIDSNVAMTAVFPRDEYGLYIQNEAPLPIPIGGYPVARWIVEDRLMDHVFVEIVTATPGATINFVIRVGGLVLYGPQIVTYGTPFSDESASVQLTAEQDLRFELQSVTGNVYGIWAQLDGEVV